MGKGGSEFLEAFVSDWLQEGASPVRKAMEALTAIGNQVELEAQGDRLDGSMSLVPR